jgi:hypothetical protein
MSLTGTSHIEAEAAGIRTINVSLKSWSGKQQISAVVAFGGIIALTLSFAGVLQTIGQGEFLIDTIAANLFTLAGIFGIATLTFGVWMSWRRVGFLLFRILSVVFGAIGVGIWPIMDYTINR